jgi:hypothetical protein
LNSFELPKLNNPSYRKTLPLDLQQQFSAVHSQLVTAVQIAVERRSLGGKVSIYLSILWSSADAIIS